MTDDRDPTLQVLFAHSEQDLAGEEFTAQVMSKIDMLKRRAVIVWIVAGVVLAASAWLLAIPLQDAVNLLTRGLSLSLISLDDQWWMQILSPMNSVTSLVALTLFGLRIAYRKIFS